MLDVRRLLNWKTCEWEVREVTRLNYNYGNLTFVAFADIWSINQNSYKQLNSNINRHDAEYTQTMIKWQNIKKLENWIGLAIRSIIKWLYYTERPLATLIRSTCILLTNYVFQFLMPRSLWTASFRLFSSRTVIFPTFYLKNFHKDSKLPLHVWFLIFLTRSCRTFRIIRTSFCSNRITFFMWAIEDDSIFPIGDCNNLQLCCDKLGSPLVHKCFSVFKSADPCSKWWWCSPRPEQNVTKNLSFFYWNTKNYFTIEYIRLTHHWKLVQILLENISFFNVITSPSPLRAIRRCRRRHNNYYYTKSNI